MSEFERFGGSIRERKFVGSEVVFESLSLLIDGSSFADEKCANEDKDD